jgi:hypothetical protein
MVRIVLYCTDILYISVPNNNGSITHSQFFLECAVCPSSKNTKSSSPSTMADFAPLGSLDPHYIALGYFSSNLKENIVIIKKSSIPFDRRNKTYPGANTYNPHNNETQYVRVRASVSKSIDSEHRQVYLSPSHAPIHERTWQVYSRQYDCCHGGRDLPQDD